MENIIVLVPPVPNDDISVCKPLFYPAVQWICDAASSVSLKTQILDEPFLANDGNGISQYALSLISSFKPDCKVLAFCKILPAITGEDLSKITLAENIVVRSAESDGPILVFCSVQELLKCHELSAFKEYSIEASPNFEELSVPSFSSICAELRSRINKKLAENGVVITDSSSTFISPSVQIEPGVTILPNCIIRGNSHIKSGAVIGPNCVLENACIGNDSSINSSQIFDSSIGNSTTVGPFAYIRPECTVGNNVRVGDFVELKKSSIGNNTKISHLTYIGDAEVGERVNFGCGCVTANYDGKQKHRTTIGNDVFLGCNTNLVAPVSVGNNSFTAAGSTVTHNVPDNSLVIARAKETLKENWVSKHGSNS